MLRRLRRRLRLMFPRGAWLWGEFQAMGGVRDLEAVVISCCLLACIVAGCVWLANGRPGL